MSRSSNLPLRSCAATALLGLLLCSPLARAQPAPPAPPAPLPTTVDAAHPPPAPPAPLPTTVDAAHPPPAPPVPPAPPAPLPTTVAPAHPPPAPPVPTPTAAAPSADERAEAEAAYETAFIAFEDEYVTHVDGFRVGSSVHGRVRTTREAVPIRGIQRERLGPVAFYTAVGRADLADAYRRGRRRKLVVGGAGIGSMVTSGVLLGVGMFKLASAQSIDLDCWPTLGDPSQAAYHACNAEEDRQTGRATRQATTWLIGSGVAFVGAVTLAAIHHSMDPHPITASARRLLAHSHNARLRRQLRLPRRPTISLTPFASASAAGLLATGHF